MVQPTEVEIRQILLTALEFRKPMLKEEHVDSLRLFNGFYEGISDLAADVYGRTLVLFSHCETETDSILLTQTARDVYLAALPWIRCVVVKHHNAGDAQLRRGQVTFGTQVDDQIQENGVHYAVDLLLNQDASFYLDTRGLREWLKQHAAGLEVLNTFAYTGSLGIAALAGGARRVIQLDLNRRFLDLARQSAVLNHMDLGKQKLQAVDFFVGVGQLKRSGTLFDLVLLDPPFFSVTEKGKVDQLTESARLINKVRPLVKDGGRIVAINNALFLEGQEYYRSLEEVTREGYVEIEDIIAVPQDITGYPETITAKPPVNSAPFNHPTKIAVLRIRRKEQSMK